MDTIQRQSIYQNLGKLAETAGFADIYTQDYSRYFKDIKHYIHLYIGISKKKLQPLRKGPCQLIAKPTEVTYKLIDPTKKETVQHRNNLLPYYPK